MALQDIAVEGVTSFTSKSYRYILELKSDDLSIWMEDRVTKEQWYTGDMTKDDYVSSPNAIPDASAADYIKCFQDSLNSHLDGASDVQRKLIPLTGEALRLELAVTIRVLRSTWVAKYAFNLDSVSVERIDVLESKLRDQQEELERLRGELNGGKAPPFIQLTANESICNTTLRWNYMNGVVSTDVHGAVKVGGGVYSIGATVTTMARHKDYVQLVKNGKVIQEVKVGYCQGYSSSAYLNVVERLEETDKLTVFSPSGTTGTSYLSIVRLGN